MTTYQKPQIATYDVNGKKAAAVHVFIDPENGFSQPGLSTADGGSLYVPAGEQVAPIMGKIINETRNGIFVLAQDYHPRNHISFITNHAGILAYRVEKYKQFLTAHGKPIPENETELLNGAQQPVVFLNGYDHPPESFPFEEIVLNADGNIIGLKEADGRIRKVTVTTESGLAPSKDDRGRVTAVSDEYLDRSFDQMRADGELIRTQTIWTEHCVQGKLSSLYPDSMGLPKGLVAKLDGDLMKDQIYYRDPETGNQFYVVRKGADSEIDSYGLGVENDGKTKTAAVKVFGKIGDQLKANGVEHVDVNIGGLATNFCVEFSANHVADFLAGEFKMRGMTTAIHYVPEISRAIPIPGGPEIPFSADGAAGRMEQTRGIHTISVEALLAKQNGKPGTNISGDLNAQSIDKGQQI